MAEGVQLKIRGVEQVNNTLKNLPPAMQKRALKPSMRTAMRIVRDKIKSNIQSSITGESTGTLERSLRIYNLRNRGQQLRTAVMVKRGLVYPGRFYKNEPLRVGLVAGVFEYGKQGQAPKSPFRNAAREAVGATYNALVQAISSNIDKALDAAKRGGA